MRCDEYSEWDEYVGLESIKRSVENAISNMHSCSEMLDKVAQEKKSSYSDIANFNSCYLDVARVALISVLRQLDECKMIGTIIEKKNEKKK